MFLQFSGKSRRIEDLASYATIWSVNSSILWPCASGPCEAFEVESECCMIPVLRLSLIQKAETTQQHVNTHGSPKAYLFHGMPV